MPCSHCKESGHNRRTCPQLKKLNEQPEQMNLIPHPIQPPIQEEYVPPPPPPIKDMTTLLLEQQNKEYQEGLEKDLKKQKEEELAAPTIDLLRQLRLARFSNKQI
tara:strand:+ start:218 stop:532 length:315 start_codon:yes stop_codon:yes gene_type:complete